MESELMKSYCSRFDNFEELIAFAEKSLSESEKRLGDLESFVENPPGNIKMTFIRSRKRRITRMRAEHEKIKADIEVMRVSRMK
jgi:hypothetical protein